MKDSQKFISFIVVFTVGFYWLNDSIKIPYFSAGLVSLIIFIIFLLWDRVAWKIKKYNIVPTLGNLVGFYNYPSISGTWAVNYKSSYNYDSNKNRYTTQGTGRAEIKQTYSSLFITCDFGNESSNSESFIAKLKQKENGEWFLIYGYQNRPRDPRLANSLDGGMHEGFCYLTVKSNKLEGYYTNDEGRKTRGKITFTKQV